MSCGAYGRNPGYDQRSAIEALLREAFFTDQGFAGQPRKPYFGRANRKALSHPNAGAAAQNRAVAMPAQVPVNPLAEASRIFIQAREPAATGHGARKATFK